MPWPNVGELIGSPGMWEEVLGGLITTIIVAVGGLMSGLGRKAAQLVHRRIPALNAPGWPNTRYEQLVTESRILVVDDQQWAHHDRLRRQNFHVTHHHQIEADANTPLDDRFDLLILDVRGIRDPFGASDGVEALVMLRRLNPWIPIIVCSAYFGDLTADQRAIITQHTQDAIEKDVDYPELEDRLVALLRRSRTRLFFEERLGATGVANANAALSSMEHGKAAEQCPLDWVAGSPPTPIREAQARRLLKVAASVYRGKRWPHR